MNWQPCTQGTISSASALVRSRKSAESRRSFLKSASAAAVVVAGGGFAAWTLQDGGDQRNALYNNPNYPGGIACSEVVRILPQYIDESMKDAELVENMDVHLAGCKHCRDKYNMMTA